MAVLHVLIPTRGDRSKLLQFAKKQLSSQSRQPDHICVVDDPPVSSKKDVTWRYRMGCERCFAAGAELVVFIEDDDWYHPEYLEWIEKEWEACGRPACIGVPYTYYYHVGSRRYARIEHPGRASAMSSAVGKEVLSMRWPADTEPFFDVQLWKQLRGRTVDPELRYPGLVMSVGIKHGIGLSGGIGHKNGWGGYKNNDPDMSWLGSVVGDDVEFYKSLL